MSETQQKVPENKGADSTKKKQPRWILHYNSLSATLWFVVLSNTIYFTAFYGQPQFFTSTSRLLTVIQCFAAVEIYNSLVGNVRAPLFTTIAQVSSRLLVVLGVFTVLPNSEINYGFAYVTLSIAWSITEIVRYSFYAINIETGGNAPDFLVWLRYSTFIPLYPLGISSECWIIYNSLTDADNVVGVWYKWFFIGSLLTYVPGSYVLFTYMLNSRKKVMKSLKEQSDKKKK
ncbi:enoyl-CoA hydratase [Saccharomycopsis crataegensis]|uniref:Very-long-chain (3R)-3-hydroxyacyl-CoA dehydratase n=1 Tax=Saccharomycopsis crataegensis TaxID=43959 RepID=A0AAV5QFS9_9ASCO|nr:enoyl-CoA hydratase [Saccharomycopsis crataegensis]